MNRQSDVTRIVQHIAASVGEVIDDVVELTQCERPAARITLLAYCLYIAELELPLSDDEVGEFRQDVATSLANGLAKNASSTATVAAAIESRRASFFRAAMAVMGGRRLAEATYFRGSLVTRQTILDFDSVGHTLEMFEWLESQGKLSDDGYQQMRAIRSNPGYVGVDPNVELDARVIQALGGIHQRLKHRLTQS